MKPGIHPVYRDVIYKDVSSGYAFLTRSTAHPTETERWEDGKEYLVVKVEISSASHPFYTGKNRLVDAAGRVEKFNQKYAKKAPSKGEKKS
jgi:large subunit ribosomal protein L31